MKIIVGLGNPGDKYKSTRHNSGFLFLDYLQKKLEFPGYKNNKGFTAEITEGEINNEKTILVKPLTFMNLSGEAVQKIYSYYKCNSEDLIVIYDDLDLPFGTIRVRKSGSAGSHNGMKSIVNALGDTFPRIRIGIENRNELLKEKQDSADYVLSNFNKEELKILSELFEKIEDAIKKIIKGDFEAAMNSHN